MARLLAIVAVQALTVLSLAAREDDGEGQAALRAFQRGGFDEAAAHWQRSADANHREGRKAEEAADLLNLAGAYQALGQHSHALNILQQAAEVAQQTADPNLMLQARSGLAVGQLMLHQADKAEAALREVLPAARTNGAPRLTAVVLNDLGMVLAAQKKYGEALASFEESAATANQSGLPEIAARALANAASAAERSGNAQKAESLNGDCLKLAAQLQAGHESAFLLLTTAQTDDRLRPTDGAAGRTRLLIRSQKSARRALEIAEEIQDPSISTYALGQLARLYEQDGQIENALGLSRRAAFAAQKAQLPDALYQWEWLTGRLLRSQGKTTESIASYRRAVQTLQPIRHDIALGYGNASAELSFRESLGPMFFELADLLLTQSETETDPDQLQKLLAEARDTVEQLKAVELEDYFQDDCCDVVRAKSASLEKVDPQSAVLYIVPLPNRTEILVSLASGILRFKADVGSDALVATVRQFRRNLETRTTYAYLEQSQQLYDWLIRPIHNLLTQNQIKTLVFVPDGALQTIPLASLHDGTRFLVEEFAVAITPGLSVVEPRPIERRNAQVLLSGLSDAVQGFPSLEFVPDELQKIETEYRSEKLLNSAFQTSALEKKLAQEQFSIVHIASHGQFDHDGFKTFVLTYDGKLTLNKLESLIRPSQYRGKPVELLVLSACQTAAGDDRAALGLAGVAVKAGARSALASLWFVNDQSTEAFVSELYDQLRQPSAVSRARAVQAAQLKMLADRRYRHPCYWAPYLLIGNWL